MVEDDEKRFPRLLTGVSPLPVPGGQQVTRVSRPVFGGSVM